MTNYSGFARVIALSMSLCFGTACAGTSQALTVPAGFSAPVILSKKSAGDCQTAPEPFVQVLDFPSKYEGSGSSRDELNSDAEQRYKGATAGISTFETGIAALTSRYLQSGAKEDLNCTLGWLDRWATTNALLGKAETPTGKAVRKWALAAVSASYLRLQRSSTKPLQGHEELQQHIESWLKAVANQVAVEWPVDAPVGKVNNHYYWAAWSLVATGVALNDRGLFDHGLAIYKTFERQITVEGLLPNELKRSSRALGYHAYALSPLTMIATFANANGETVEVGAGSPLQRLATTVFNGFEAPERFVRLVGAKQETSNSIATNYGWLEPYCSIADCSGAMASFLQSHRPMKSTRMGGDLTALFSGVPKQ